MIKFLKHNFKIIIIYIVFLIICLIPLPYYVYAPGGIVNIKNRIEIDSAYQSKGSFNLSYVSEYKANPIILLIASLNNNWDVFSKKDIVINNETIEDNYKRDQLLMRESYENATKVAYHQAGKDIKVLQSDVYVAYLFDENKSNLKIGDKISSINGTLVKDKEHLNSIINKYKAGDTINIKVDEIVKKAKLIEYKNKPIIGIGVIELSKMKTKPIIKYKYDNSEYGSSGGLMLTLAIYNALTKKDITKGRTIVGTGTIDANGAVGKIDGVKYKIKGASKKKIDLFIVPNKNLKEALKVKKKNKYKFRIIGVDTFDEVIKYLNS